MHPAFRVGGRGAIDKVMKNQPAIFLKPIRHADLPEECDCVGRVYFARSPGSDVWVNFYDLPEATRDALWEKHGSKLAFPAGFEECFRGKERKQS